MGTLQLNLNRQVIYNANQPQLSWDNIASYTAPDLELRDVVMDNDSSGNSNLESLPVTIGNDNSVLSVANTCDIGCTSRERTIPEAITLDKMNPLLSSEVELMNICHQLKTPLNGFKLIWEWVINYQTKKDLILHH